MQINYHQQNLGTNVSYTCEGLAEAFDNGERAISVHKTNELAPLLTSTFPPTLPNEPSHIVEQFH